jgi:nuclear pore complex protein Nup155
MNESINDIIDHIINKTRDELAHVYIFNWLVESNQSEKLFKLNSEFIEPYLKLKTLLNPKIRSYLDLLWRYYDQKKDYLCAAQVLVGLAETQQFEIILNDRINYLTHAIVALQSSLKISYKEEESELKDKLDIALIQHDIYKQLCKEANSNDATLTEALKLLNSQLFDITKVLLRP